MATMMKNKRFQSEEEEEDKRSATKKKVKLAKEAEEKTCTSGAKFLLRQTRYYHLEDKKDLKNVESYCRRAGMTQVPAYDIIKDNNNETGPSMDVSPYDYYHKEVDMPHLVRMIPYPPTYRFTSNFANLVWKSHLFFIAGLLPKDCVFTSLVLSFDMEKQTWNETWNPMNTPRCGHTGVVHDDKIYVFGNISHISIPKPQWGEVFDIAENKWSYLPSPPDLLHQLQQPRTYSLYYKCKEFSYTTQDNTSHRVPQNQDLILFPLRGNGSPISVFNCTDNTWLPDLYPELPARASIFPNGILNSRDRLAVVDGVLLWHLDQAIHGYDFLNREFLPNLFEIPPSRRHDDDHYGYPHQPPIFLVQPEDRRSLFFIFQYSCDPFNVHCYEFVVHLRQRDDRRHISLVRESYSRLSTKSTAHNFLQDVLPL